MAKLRHRPRPLIPPPSLLMIILTPRSKKRPGTTHYHLLAELPGLKFSFFGEP